MTTNNERRGFFQTDELCPTQVLRIGLAALEKQHLDGFTLEETAEMMGFEVKTVKQCIGRYLTYLSKNKDQFIK